MKITVDNAMSILRGVTYVVTLLSLPILAFKALPLLERAVVVLENVDKRIDNATKELAPLGKAGITKGVEAVKSVDGEQVGRDITDAIRRRLGKDKR